MLFGPFLMHYTAHDTAPRVLAVLSRLGFTDAARSGEGLLDALVCAVLEVGERAH